MFTRIPDSPIKPNSVFGAVLISSVISLASFADDLSPAELRYLAIETEVALESDWQIAPYELKVEPQNGSLVVTGEVSDDASRAVAEWIARRTCRAYSIEIVNKIRVKYAETQPGSVKEPIPTTLVNNTQVRRQRDGENIVYAVSRKEPRAVVAEKDRSAVSVTKKPLPPTDAELAEQLAVVLNNDPIIKDFRIESTVDDGVVWLAGRVVNLGQKLRAIRLAEEHPGVRYVIDRLGLLPGVPRASNMHIPDRADVTFYMRRYLRLRWPALLDSTVQVVEQTIVITPQTERLITPAEIRMIENFLARIPELKAYTFQVRPILSIVTPDLR